MNFKPLLVSLIGFCLLFPKVILAQLPTNNYENQWKQVDELIKKEQPKSALNKVRSIYALAKKDKQDARSVYWQYFEDVDKISSSSTPLNLSKKLFVEKNTDRGPVLTPVNEGDELHVGDKIKVRIELRVDRDMEYVNMKDMRASCLERLMCLNTLYLLHTRVISATELQLFNACMRRSLVVIRKEREYQW